MTADPQRDRGSPLPGSLLVFLSVIVVGLLSGIVLSYVAARETDQRLAALEEYVQGRGEFRDAEAARMEDQGRERIRQAMCDLLDTLPEGGLLERPRAEYGCGPGIPLSELPPEQAEQLRNQRAAPLPSLVVPTPNPTPAAPPTPGPAPAPGAAPEPPLTPFPPTASEPPPLVDLGPYTRPLCESVRICNRKESTVTSRSPIPQTPGRGDHAAPSNGLLASLPARTLLQGIALDVLLALCLVVYQASSGEAVDWRLLLAAVVRTLLQTVASSVMKRVKPPATS